MFEYSSFSLAWFLAAGSLVLLVVFAAGLVKTRARQRIEELAVGGTTTSRHNSIATGAPGVLNPNVLNPSSVDRLTRKRIRQEEGRELLKKRMTQAGFYNPRAIGLVFSLRLVFLATAVGLGVIAGTFGPMSLNQGVLVGALVGLAGTMAPGLWLNSVRRRRQIAIRRALPDALDIMVICLEGGVSLAGSFARVSRELVTAQPMLAVEFNVVQRQIELGNSTGEAIRSLADRFDLDELRSMASVITQAEKMGSSVVTALQVFADTLRQKRHQRAEELGHQAAVKLLFPTIFFIFPGIFIVILGPAAIQIYQRLLQGAFKTM